MPREKYQTLTEQMFYILLCLQKECCGVDIMEMVRDMTGGRVTIGPGTLYTLLDNFLKEGFIRETRSDGRKRSYIIEPLGNNLLEEEYKRLGTLIEDYNRVKFISEDDNHEKA